MAGGGKTGVLPYKADQALRRGCGLSANFAATSPVYGKFVTLGVRRTLGVVAPPVLSMTLLISPLAPMQTVIKSRSESVV